MVSLQIRGRNKPLLPDAQASWAGGMVSSVRANALQPDQAQELVNVDLRNELDASTRRGAEQLGAEAGGSERVRGAAYFDTVTTEKLVRVIKTSGVMQVQTHDGVPASAWSVAGGWTPSDADVEIVQGNNKLFFGNGTDNLRSWDGAAFTDMGTGFPNPPKMALLAYLTNRLLGAGDPANPDTLYASNILGEGVWSGANSVRVGAGDGDPITALYPWSGFLLLVGKRSSVWVVNCDPTVAPGSWEIKCITRTSGVVGPRAMVGVGKDVWFLSDTGWRSVARLLDAASAGADAEVGPALSWPVQGLFDAMNRAAAATCAVTLMDDRLLAAIPTGNATRPNIVVAARVRPDGSVVWLGKWTGWTPCVWVRSTFGGAERMNFGQSDGRVLRWRNYTAEADESSVDYRDAGAAIPTTLHTRAMHHGQTRNSKKGFTCEIEFNRSTSPSVTVTPYIDGAAAPALATITSALGAVVFPLTFPIAMPSSGIKRAALPLIHTMRYRELALRLHSASGKLSVRTVAAEAFPETYQLSS
jgi:hypothetical protein